MEVLPNDLVRECLLRVLYNSHDEKTGGGKILEKDSGKLKILPEQLKLVDIETSNGIFTWSNRRSGSQHVACRLDCFLVTEHLLERDLCIESFILPQIGSDYWPIALQVAMEATLKFKPFRFEKFWLTHPDFQQLAQTWWNQGEIQQGTNMYKF
jgi:hypothetical protein